VLLKPDRQDYNKKWIYLPYLWDKLGVAEGIVIIIIIIIITTIIIITIIIIIIIILEFLTSQL